jgi:hypothetical protein
MFFDITVVPSGVVHEMEMSLDLTPSTVSTEHWREYVSPAVELPKGFTFTIGGLRSFTVIVCVALAVMPEINWSSFIFTEHL